MTQHNTSRLLPGLVFGLVLALASTAFAQSTMIKGKVVDAKGEPVVGVAITVEFQGGVNRKLNTKTDKRGEFIQLLTEGGAYKITATDPKLGSSSAETRVRLNNVSTVNIVLAPGAGGPDPKAVELKKTFEEGVALSRSGNHDGAIEKFTAAAAMTPACFDCYYNIGVAQAAKKDDKAAEASWMKALEIKADYPEAMNALAQLYNNQKRFEEAAAMSAKAAAASGGAGNPDAAFNQGIILWNQGKIADAKVKFEETIKANPNHADAHYQLGMALLNEGKLAEAVGSFETYLKLSPDGSNAATAKAMIAQLKK